MFWSAAERVGPDPQCFSVTCRSHSVKCRSGGDRESHGERITQASEYDFPNKSLSRIERQSYAAEQFHSRQEQAFIEIEVRAVVSRSQV